MCKVPYSLQFSSHKTQIRDLVVMDFSAEITLLDPQNHGILSGV